MRLNAFRIEVFRSGLISILLRNFEYFYIIIKNKCTLTPPRMSAFSLQGQKTQSLISGYLINLRKHVALVSAPSISSTDDITVASVAISFAPTVLLSEK